MDGQLLEKILLLQNKMMGALMPDAPVLDGGCLADGSAEDPSKVKDESRPDLAQSRRPAPQEFRERGNAA